MKLEKILIILTLSAVIILLSAVRISEYLGSISTTPSPKKNAQSGSVVDNQPIQPLASPSPEPEVLTFDMPAATTDPFNNPLGPFYQSIHVAVSADGTSFTKDSMVLDKAAVPHILRLSDGRLALYAVDGAYRSKSGLMVALSSDEGKTWTQGSVKFDQTATVGMDPDVVLLADGTLRMYFVVPGAISSEQASSSAKPASMNSIRSATSTDGVHFTLESGNRFAATTITDPDVVAFNGTWYMYVSQGSKLLSATSPDGLTFTLGKTIRSRGASSSTVLTTDTTLRQFYCDSGIKSATSSDGVTWKDEPGYRLRPATNETICDPAPYHVEGDNWLLYYKVIPKK